MRTTTLLALTGALGLLLTPAVAGVAGSTAAAASHAARQGRVVHVHATIRGTSPLTGSADQCIRRGGDYDPHGVPTSYSGTMVVHGTLEGTATFCGWIPPAVNSDGSLNYLETDTFTGTLAGCGRGSLTYDIRGRVYPAFDPQHTALKATETWSVDRGSGTGELAGVTSGGGHQPAWLVLTPTTDERGTPATELDGGLEGVIRCTPR